MKITVVSILIIFSCVLHAGGSDEDVEILLFSFFGEDKYVLAVKPINDLKNKGSYMGSCSIYTVIGRYEKSGFLESGYRPSKKEYFEAIAYLKTKPTKIKLGWMGSGFHVLDKQEPCVVESKALKILDSENGKAVYSWFEGT